MKTQLLPWLVQRGTIRFSPDREGIDALVGWDYMGSSEYEWGALGRSLKRIRSSTDYTLSHYLLKGGKRLGVYCRKEDFNDVCDVLDMLARGKFRLKEASELDLWAYPETARYKTRCDFWWDIDHDWMAWADNAAFEAKLVTALTPSSNTD